MAKVLKIMGKGVLGITEWLLVVLIILVFALKTSWFQTYAANKATKFLSAQLDVPISIKKIDISFLDRAELKEFIIYDQKQDTLAYIESFYANISDYDFKKAIFNIDDVELRNAVVKLRTYKGEKDLNLQFIIDQFSSDTPTPPSDGDFLISIKDLNLENVRFIFEDQNDERTPFGVDYTFIDARNTNLIAKDVEITKDVYKANIISLSTQERSGFNLNKLYGKTAFSEKGLKINDLGVETAKSNIKASKLNWNTADYNSYSYFLDSVFFDAELIESKVSMEDVSYFAPQLKGMNEDVVLKTTVSRPISSLAMRDFDLKFGENSYINGDLYLPNFDNLRGANFHEKLKNFYITTADLQRVKMPSSLSFEYLELPNEVLRLGHFEGRNVTLDAFPNAGQYVLALNNIKTALGNISVANGIEFNEYNDYLAFKMLGGDNKDVSVNSFQLGEFLNNNQLGLVDGSFDLAGKAYSFSDISFDTIRGNVNEFYFNDYTYTDIEIKEGEFKDQKFDGKVKINDGNLDLTYDGYLDFKKKNGKERMNFSIDIDEAFLSALNIDTRDSVNNFVKGKVIVDWNGFDPNTFNGKLKIVDLEYKERTKVFKIPQMDLLVSRSELSDTIDIRSSAIDAYIIGKVNFNTIIGSIKSQFSHVLPALINDDYLKDEEKSNFTYDVKVKDASDIFKIFVPGLEVAANTELQGVYHESNEEFKLRLKSDEIVLRDTTRRSGVLFSAKNIDLDQDLQYGQIIAVYNIDEIFLTDTLNCDNFHLTTIGYNNTLDSQVSWNSLDNNPNPTSISWTTDIINDEEYRFDFSNSFFTLKDHRWDIEGDSRIYYAPDSIDVDCFSLHRLDQYLNLDGILSMNEKDRLDVELRNIDLADFSLFLESGVRMKGILNGEGYLSTPFTNLVFNGGADVDNFYVNNEEVGDITVKSYYNNEKEKIELIGNLNYRNVKTFDFVGDYFTKKEKDNLDFNLDFKQADLSVVNAFMDPQVVSNLKGFLDGKIKVTGSPNHPILNGRVDLQNGNAKMELLGANFKFDGEVYVDEYGIYIDNMPITDEEGNAGSMVGQVFHDNFENFNFDLSFNLEDDAINRDPYQPYRVLPLEKFMVMNTHYKPGEVYYGKAYITGTANISGYADNMYISVNAESKKGTWVNFPMYGADEIEEDEFIRFISSKDTNVVSTEPKIDFTGIDLDLNFDVTPETRLKLIFDENIGDEITAFGEGELNISLDNYNELTMEGLFAVKNGIYNFAMGPYKQNLYIQEGGTVQWTGSPYEAAINLSTYYKTNANLSAVITDVIDNKTSDNEEIYCFLNLDGDMTKPNITFDIAAPKTAEAGKAVISRIRSDKDELNRQFFSLLIWKRFQPLNSQTQAGGSAALDLVSTQINSLLSQVSEDYKLNVNLDSDELTGDNSVEFGVSKGFLDDRLIFKGSFGVENRNQTDKPTQSSFIGDVSLEYLLNESGTFRVNVFNESNDYSLIQDNNVGQFTQGIGLHYQEEFENAKDFKLFQYIADRFRKTEDREYKYSKNKNKKPIPQRYKNNPELLKEEE